MTAKSIIAKPNRREMLQLFFTCEECLRVKITLENSADWGYVSMEQKRRVSSDIKKKKNKDE